MIWSMEQLAPYLGITLAGAVGVAISATVLYLMLGLVIRIWGRRFTVSASPLSLVVVTLISAVAARAVLGESPTLAGGVIGIGTLLLMEQIFGHWGARFTKNSVRPRWRRAPVILMIGNQLQEQALRKYGVTETHLWSRLRQRGVFDRNDVDLVILEPRGDISVVRAGDKVSPETLVGVQGMEKVPPEMIHPER